VNTRRFYTVETYTEEGHNWTYGAGYNQKRIIKAQWSFTRAIGD
jgi:hypothetical protein